jgi:acetate---CoA ligase (ADP-forming)
VGFPYLQGLPQTIRAMSAMAFYGARAGRQIDELAAPRGSALEAAQLGEALASHGLTPPASGFGATPQAAADMAARIGFPVALKLVSPQISHKTEVGGVRIGLASAEEVMRAAQQITQTVGERAPDAVIEGFLVQEMARGVEVLLGVRTDPLYGPMMVVGAGGVFVELMKDISCRLLPVNPVQAREMIGELKLAKLLAGYRGAAPADMEALVAAICGLSDFYLDHRHTLADLEVNPLIVLEEGKGVRAVDIRSTPFETEGGRHGL